MLSTAPQVEILLVVLAVAEATSGAGCANADTKKRYAETNHDGCLNTGLGKVCVCCFFLSCWGFFGCGCCVANGDDANAAFGLGSVSGDDNEALGRNVVGDVCFEATGIVGGYWREVARIAHGCCIGETFEGAASACTGKNEERFAGSEA